MRTGGALESHIEQTTTTLAVCWRLVTLSGDEFGFTSCSRTLSIDGLDYLANTGMEPTAVECSAGLAVDNSEVLGFIKPGVIEADQVRAGRFDGATVYKFIVNYEDPDGDQIKLLWGVLGEVQVKGQQFTAEMRGGSQWFAAQIVPLTQATCRAPFGDPVQCKADKLIVPAQVTTVASRKLFQSDDLVGAAADGLFDYGYVVWTSGDNEGLRHDVRHYDQATGEVLLMAEVAIPISDNDQFEIHEGCAKTRAACKTKTGPDGLNNILNFDAEPDIPGNDVVLRIVRAS